MLEATFTITYRIQCLIFVRDCARSIHRSAFAPFSPRARHEIIGGVHFRHRLHRILPLSRTARLKNYRPPATPRTPPVQAETKDQPRPATPPSSGQVPRVTTTVQVRGEVQDNYFSNAVTVGALDGATLQETPLSATEVTRDLLNDQVSRLLSDVVKNDASDRRRLCARGLLWRLPDSRIRH